MSRTNKAISGKVFRLLKSFSFSLFGAVHVSLAANWFSLE